MGFVRRFCLLIVAAWFSACGVDEVSMTDDSTLDEADQGIIGGVAAASGAVAASTVMFVPLGGDGTHGCSATVIDAAHALTAAHCLIGLQPGDQADLLFAPVVSATVPRRRVTSFKSASAGLQLTDDLAVLTFSGGLPVGYQPVALAKKTFTLRAGQALILAGFGQTNSTQNDRGTLHVGDSVFKRTQTGHKYLAQGATSICSGDSGGPDFVLRNGVLVQVGVHVSGDCATSDISTDVRAYSAFITSTGATPTFR